MKDCRECEYFGGYDYSDGTPNCDCDGGYECCPYNTEASVKKTGMKIEIDAGFMHDYIAHTLRNTVENCTVSFVQAEIRNVISDQLKFSVVEEVKQQAKAMVEKAMAEFMEKEIVVGGGWREPERTITRAEYLAEIIEKELADKFKSDPLRGYAQREAQSAIDNYTRRLRDEVNMGVKTYFDAATREVLTSNVVSMLMCNDTYKKLSDSMQTFLPAK